MRPALEPFTIATPQSALDDLHERLRRTRLPEEPAGAGCVYGTSLADGLHDRAQRPLPPPPDEWVKRAYNCARRTDLRQGGHFAAYQNGADFVEDLRAFFRPFRAR
ncbi:MAG: epoxide hydrolase N-terminal domain-containing protein [Candidatus Rokuibacteriota bacterium]